MERFAPALFILGAAIVAASFLYFGVWAAKKRREALERAAQMLRLSFSAAGDDALLSSLSGLHLFAIGQSRRMTNLMRGEIRGERVAVFDYRYSVQAGKNRHVRSQTVLCLPLQRPALPSFALRPERAWHKIGSRLGYQDIDFENHPDFSGKYLLRGEDEHAIRRLFSDRVVMFFEQAPQWCVEGAGDRLAIYRDRRLAKPEELRAFVEEGLSVLAYLRPSD